MEGTKRFVAGVTYLVLHQWGTLWVSSEFFNSPEFFVSFYTNLIQLFTLGDAILSENILEYHLVPRNHVPILRSLAFD